MERLDKRLTATGQWSRKEAKELIRAGRVCVQGQVCQNPEEKVGENTPVWVDGAAIGADTPIYLMLHKPAGVVSATEDEQEKTVLDLLPCHYQGLGLFPVGRLDKDTEGLLLLCNDGPLAHRLLSPRRHVDKVYYVEVDAALEEVDVQAVREGVVLRDGYQCMPGEMELLPGKHAAYITIREGKYHQIKRMMASRGKRVTYLKRIRFGPLELDGQLDKGGWRALTEEEKHSLFRQ